MRGRTRRRLRIGFATSLAIAAGLGLWAFWWEPASLRVREHRVAPDGWPAHLSGLRVAVLADLHVGSPYQGLHLTREIVRRTNAASPDVVLIAGDLVIQGVVGGRFVAPEESAAALGAIQARYGVFAVLGNHDWWLDGQRVARALDGAGIAVLEDVSRRIDTAEGPLWIAGVSDFWEAPHDIAAALRDVPANAPLVVFTHNPDLFPEIPDRVHLTVAGHTHGGQVNLPLLGRLVVPSKFGDRYAAGLVVEAGRHLFVSTGLGTSILPVRFRVPPEVSLLIVESPGG